jgi:hypothetical protein
MSTRRPHPAPVPQSAFAGSRFPPAVIVLSLYAVAGAVLLIIFTYGRLLWWRGPSGPLADSPRRAAVPRAWSTSLSLSRREEVSSRVGLHADVRHERRKELYVGKLLEAVLCGR